MALIINDEKIDDDVILQQVQTIGASAREHPDQYEFESQEELVEYAKEDVICRTLLQQKAEKKIESVEVEKVDTALAELKEQCGGEKEFYEAYGLDGSHDAEIKGNIETNLKVQQLMDEICADVAEATAEEARAYYDENGDEFVMPEEIHVSHIVKRPAEGQAEETFARMKDLRRQLRAGADFSALASEHSDCSENGGDLGFFAPGQMVEEFEAVVMSMDDDEISPVFMTQFGYHIAKVHGRQAERPCPFEDVEENIREQLTHDRKNDRIGQYVDQIKKDATIVELPPEPPQEEQEESDAEVEDAEVEDAETEES